MNRGVNIATLIVSSMSVGVVILTVDLLIGIF